MQGLLAQNFQIKMSFSVKTDFQANCPNMRSARIPYGHNDFTAPYAVINCIKGSLGKFCITCMYVWTWLSRGTGLQSIESGLWVRLFSLLFSCRNSHVSCSQCPQLFFYMMCCSTQENHLGSVYTLNPHVQRCLWCIPFDVPFKFL